MKKASDKNGFRGTVQEYINFLENRIERLEEILELPPLEWHQDISLPEKSADFEERKDALEYKIGEFWFAKTGILISVFGIIFTLSLPFGNLPLWMPGAIGFLLTLVLWGSSLVLQKSFLFISKYLFGSALVLLFFSVMRLHFFAADQPFLTKTVTIIFLSLVVIISLAAAIKRNSVYLASVSLTLGYITVLCSENIFFIFGALTILAILAVFFRLKYEWNKLVLYSIFLTFFSHFVWFINNPLLGNDFGFVSGQNINLLFILLYMFIFAMGNFLRPKEQEENDLLILNTSLSCAMGFGLFLLVSLATAGESIFFYHLPGSLIFLLLSYLFWWKEQSKYSSFFYSISGFTALSVAIIAGSKNPDYFLFLSWQALLVAALALLYKSKIIVIANFFIFLIVFIAYLFLAEDHGLISFSFGLVALLSARILNWQKVRLDIKTELMRNAYLVIAFFDFPYSLYHLIPAGYISISWIGLAICYYLLAIFLNNKKYRWMALYTLILTAFYLLFAGIGEEDPFFRILSFLSLGIALLLISFIYSRTKSKEKNAK